MTPKMTLDAEQAMKTMINWLAPILREPTANRINWVLESMMLERGVTEADKFLVVEAARYVLPANYEIRLGKILGTGKSTREQMKPVYSDLEAYYTFPRLVKRVSIDAGKPPKPANQMKVLAFTAGTRKDGNSDILTAEALRGAKDAGASIEVIRLSELPIGKCFSTLLNENYTELREMYPDREFKYCEYAMERTGGDHKGYCAVGDKMPEIFQKIEQADAILFSFPIYTDWETSLIANFYERWIRYEFCMGAPPKPGRRGMVIATWGSLNTRVYKDIIDHVIENLFLRKINVVEIVTNCGFVGIYSGLDENYKGIANHFPKIMEMNYMAGRSLVTGERNQTETVVETRAPGQMEPVKIIPGKPPVA
jgi:multimeric flavodoxin WrbA